MQRITPLRALAASLALAQSATAAVHVSPHGEGQVLLFPYYTVNAQNSTLLSLANHTDEVKAVKVRFREAMNGRSALDFNLYLGPFASWRAAVTVVGEAGPARLITADRACTVPAIPQEGIPFHAGDYTGVRDDDGPDTLDRTREGFIEVIEMGVVVDDGDVQGPRLPLPDASGNRSGVDNAVENSGRRFAHDASPVDGAAPDCEALEQAWTGGVWVGTPDVDLDEPSGGLAGSISIVDVQDGVNHSQRAEALDGFFTVADSALHTPPGSLLPTLASARTRAGGPVEAVVEGQILRWSPETPDAVSSVLMHRRALNEFHNMPSVLATSEWVLTFPTRHLHIDAERPGVIAPRPFADDSDDSPENLAVPGNIQDASVFDPEGSCERIDLTIRSIEGEVIEPLSCELVCDPPPPALPPPQLCHQTNVLAWNQAAAVASGATELFGARRVARDFEVYDSRGEWVDRAQVAVTLGDERNFMIADPGSPAGTVRDRLFGLPSIGFWAARYVNANAVPGMLANYALLVPHVWSAERDRVTVTDETAPGGIAPVTEE